VLARRSIWLDSGRFSNPFRVVEAMLEHMDTRFLEEASALALRLGGHLKTGH
jgi:hypothetical protein